jgi:hypothetical protein
MNAFMKIISEIWLGSKSLVHSIAIAIFGSHIFDAFAADPCFIVHTEDFLSLSDIMKLPNVESYISNIHKGFAATPTPQNCLSSKLLLLAYAQAKAS